MTAAPAFADVLDAADQLDPDAQAELVAVLCRRQAARGRERVTDAVTAARQEFAAGGCRPATPAELVAETGMRQSGGTGF